MDYLDYENINDYDYTHIDDLKNNIKYIYIEFILDIILRI